MFNGNWGTFKGVKCPGCDSDQAPLSTTKVKIEWNFICASHIYQSGVDRDKIVVVVVVVVVVYVP
jgi:ribosomal protein S27E